MLRKKAVIATDVFIRKYFDEFQLWKEEENEIDLLVQLVNSIRPSVIKKEAFSILHLVEFFKNNQTEKQNFTLYLKSVLQDKNFESILTDAGILQDIDFFYEVKKRLYAKILPYQAPKNTLQYVFNQVFYIDSDPIWINKIPVSELESLFDLFEFNSIYESVEPNTPLFEVMSAINLLSQRTSGKALETEVMKMVPEYSVIESPFAAFEKELYAIENTIRGKDVDFYTTFEDDNFKQLLVFHKNCNEFVEKAFQNSSKYGISLRVNQNLLSVKQHLYRIGVLLPLLVIDKPEEKKSKSIELTIKLIKYNCLKTNVRKLFNESTQLLSYEITQHTAKTGENYITETKTGYFKMLSAAMGGGLIVGVLCIFKLLLSKIDASHFGHAFLYSMNYSFGFITIYILGFTLATKQPAMTAAALISALEDGLKKQSQGNDNEKHKSFAILFARLFRSQFIAFVGNVIMAFPVALLGIWLIDTAFDYNIAEAKWIKLVNDLNPIQSWAILHAAIAGFFLFLSGIISGSIANRDKHFDVYYRIKEHPLLKMKFGKAKAEKISKWYERYWAGIVSNFWFGIFLGSTASVGLFLGLNLDIRHITFASGNLALAVYGSHNMVNNTMLFWGVLGIGIIGFVNFIISFSLSLGLAFRSRNIPFAELRPIVTSIKRHFIRKPMSFFFPTE